MPVASLLLPLLKPLLRVIRSVLALLPVLLRPPPMAPRLSPLALPRPPFVQRLALFALRPLAFLATASNHARPPHRPAVHRPAACPLALWQSTRVRRQARQACVRLIPLLGESNRVGASRVGARGLRLNPSPEGEQPCAASSSPSLRPSYPSPGEQVKVRGLRIPLLGERVGVFRGVKGWGEGLPVEASPRGAITPSRPHPAPNPAKKRPAATEEFFRKNS